MPLPVAVPVAPPVAPAESTPAPQDPNAATTQGQPAESAPAPAPAPEPNADGEQQHPDAQLDEEGEPAAGEQRKPRGVQKRLDEMRRQIGDQQRLNERLLDIVTQTLAGKKPEVPSADAQRGPPKREDFETYDDYIDAKTRYQVGVELSKAYRQAQALQAQEQQQQAEREWQAREAKVAEKYKDYVEKVIENESLNITEVMAAAIKSSEIGGEIAYFLGNNPAEADRIAGLSPAAQAAAIGKIEARLEQQPTATPRAKPSDAPPPTKPVKPTPPADEFDLSKATTQKEFEEIRARQIKAAGGARW